MSFRSLRIRLYGQPTPVRREMDVIHGAQLSEWNQIILLPDRDGDGIAETRAVFLSGLHSPVGWRSSGANDA